MDNLRVKSLLAAVIATGLAGFFYLLPSPDSESVAEEGAGIARPTQSKELAIVDVRLFDGERILPRATVVASGGRIVAAGPEARVPAGAEIFDGRGKTLLPGLIDSHVHVFGGALRDALRFGVTTELDMFTALDLVREVKARQLQDGNPGEADLLSAGTLVTAPGGHGTQFGIEIPTLSRAEDAEEFIRARIAEGSDFVKLVLEDGSGLGFDLPTLAPETLAAAIVASRDQGRLAVVHPGTHRAARLALEAGANGLVHLFIDEAPAPDFGRFAAEKNAFVIPTLTVLSSVAGGSGGERLAKNPDFAAHLSGLQVQNLRAEFPRRPGLGLSLGHAAATIRQLLEADVPILAGSDAPNPGTAHGASLHHELELLVEAGLTPVQAMKAATSAPADAFGLTDRGRIAPGLRADLLLVDGDPGAGITATRRISAVWKLGVAVNRQPPSVVPGDSSGAPHPKVPTGVISDFENGKAESPFGSGWQISTDSFRGGSSQASMAVVGEEAENRSLEIRGQIQPGFPFPWAGAMFFPGSTAMSPADLSGGKALAFRARGDGGACRLMIFSTGLGPIPGEVTFETSPEWQDHVFPFSGFGDLDGSGIQGILFTGGPTMGPFLFEIDDLELR